MLDSSSIWHNHIKFVFFPTGLFKKAILPELFRLKLKFLFRFAGYIRPWGTIFEFEMNSKQNKKIIWGMNQGPIWDYLVKIEKSNLAKT
jgi:hypothetical protein